MPRSLCLCLGLLLAGGVCLTLWKGDIRKEPAGAPEPSTGAPPVLVLLVGGESSVAALRAAIDPERIVARSEGGFALREGRIVAEDHRAAERILTDAGWLDRRLEIVPTASSPRRRSEPVGSDANDRPDGSPDLLELSRKPTLSIPEAMAALRALEGG
jgi:hypothetical protein